MCERMTQAQLHSLATQVNQLTGAPETMHGTGYNFIKRHRDGYSLARVVDESGNVNVDVLGIGYVPKPVLGLLLKAYILGLGQCVAGTQQKEIS